MTTTEQTAKRAGHKRGDGEGSIRQRPDGRWEARLLVGVKPDGKLDQRSVYGKTRAEVQKKLTDLRKRQGEGTLGDPKAERQVLRDFMARWLAATKGSIGDRTWQRYADVVRLHILPTLGNRKLAALRPDDLQRLYSAKLDAGLSALTVRYLHAVIHRALADAARWGDVPRNVADAVRKPAAPHHEIHPPSPDELRQFLAAAEEHGDPLRALWTVAVYAGCRQGELLGLTWDDLDLDAGKLTVRRTLASTSGAVPTFANPKTAGSRRTVKLPPAAVSVLRDHRQRQIAERLALGADYAAYNLVFATRLGTPLGKRNVLRDYKLALRRAGLAETYRFHDLRHAAATMLLAAGVHPKVAAERLGHSDVRMTLNVYSHVLSGLDDDAAERLERAVRGQPHPIDEAPTGD